MADWTEAPEWASDGDEHTAERRAFARAARAVRSIAGVTQADAATSVGVTGGTWSRYESATALPGPAVLSRVSAWAGVEPCALVTRDGARSLVERASCVRRARARRWRAIVRAATMQGLAEGVVTVAVAEATERAAGVGKGRGL